MIISLIFFIDKSGLILYLDYRIIKWESVTMNKKWLMLGLIQPLLLGLGGQSVDLKQNVALEISPEIALSDSLEVFTTGSNPNLVERVFYAVTSYYSKRFHSRNTASGESHVKEAYTAAHKKLPFNTLLRITNEDNGKTVMVRVNDRGPFRKGRDLDISWYAARELGILKNGVKKLRVEVLKETVVQR